MAGTDPRGTTNIPSRAPDGEPFSDANYPYHWSQADRERGYVRHPDGGRSFETIIAVGGHDGASVGAGLMTADQADALLREIRLLRLGLVLNGVAADVTDTDL